MRIIFVGDIYIKNALNFRISSDVKKLLKSGDLLLCNFEGPLITDDTKCICKAGPTLKQDIKSIALLSELNFSIFSLANNHIFDFGEEGMNFTLREISKMGLFSIGAGKNIEEAYKPVVIKNGGYSIGFIALSEWTNGAIDGDFRRSSGYAWINHSLTNKKIVELSKSVDKLIVQVHAGEEEIDIPLPEWRKRYRELIDLGAFMVIGHHPHVIQGIETYKGRKIVYSLGNFYFSEDKNNIGLLSIVDLNDKSVDYSFISIVNNGSEIRLGRGVEKNVVLETSRILGDEVQYNCKLDNFVSILWKNTYLKYLLIASGGFFVGDIRSSFINFIKLIIKYRSDSQNVLLLDTIKKESHRYVIERYLLNKNEKKID